MANIKAFLQENTVFRSTKKDHQRIIGTVANARLCLSRQRPKRPRASHIVCRAQACRDCIIIITIQCDEQAKPIRQLSASSPLFPGPHKHPQVLLLQCLLRCPCVALCQCLICRIAATEKHWQAVGARLISVCFLALQSEVSSVLDQPFMSMWLILPPSSTG